MEWHRALGLRLLGQLEVLRNDKALPLPPSKKTRALLAYLVATHQAHSRAELCELFWEGPDDPRAALRWSLTKIRFAGSSWTVWICPIAIATTSGGPRNGNQSVPCASPFCRR